MVAGTVVAVRSLARHAMERIGGPANGKWALVSGPCGLVALHVTMFVVGGETVAFWLLGGPRRGVRSAHEGPLLVVGCGHG